MANCCLIEPDEYVTLLSDELRRARKPHKCCECGETIPVGALYSHEATVFDGDFKAYRTCARCRNIRDEYFKRGWYYGNLVGDFMDCFDFDYRNGIPADFAPCQNREARHG